MHHTGGVVGVRKSMCGRAGISRNFPPDFAVNLKPPFKRQISFIFKTKSCLKYGDSVNSKNFMKPKQYKRKQAPSTHTHSGLHHVIITSLEKKKRKQG